MHLRRNRSLFSRIHTRLSLAEATPQDTAEYIARRMEMAGSSQDIFTSDALAMIHEASSGHLRDIDRVATDALKRGAQRNVKRIDPALVQQAESD